MQVHLILSGEYDETEVRVLIDEKRKIMRRGAKDSFLMAVPRLEHTLRVYLITVGKCMYMRYILTY